MEPFKAFDLRSFKIIETLGTSSEIKRQFIGWIISDKKKYKVINLTERFFTLKQFLKNKEVWTKYGLNFLNFPDFQK